MGCLSKIRKSFYAFLEKGAKLLLLQQCVRA